MQDYAISEKETPEIERRKKFAYDNFLTFCALGGLLTDDDGRVKQLKTVDFCQQFGINEATAWRWKQEPGFAEKIRNRRAEVIPLARETKVFNQLYLTALQSKDLRAAVEAQKMYLGHFSDLQLPVQRQNIKVQGGLMEVLAAAEADHIIEGEVVPDVPADVDAGTGSQDSGLLPPAS